PDKRARSTHWQRPDTDGCVIFLGADVVFIRGAGLPEGRRGFYAFGRERVGAELAASGNQPRRAPFHGRDSPADLVASDAVAVTHDEVDGIGLYANFRVIEEAVADPGFLLHPDYRPRLRAYLRDPTVSPLLVV